MRLWKSEVWPWNWRKVRKAQISKVDRDLFERYGEAVIGSILAGEVPIARDLRAILPHSPPGQPLVIIDKFQEAGNWLTECRDAHERREQRLESIEIGVVALITVEILLSFIFGGIGILEASKQGNVLDHMDAIAAATADTMEKVRDELKSLAADQAKAREILEEQERDRLAQLAKKPALVLLVGHVPLTKVPGVFKPSQETDNSATFNFVLQNMGDGTANRVYFRALAPPEVTLVATSPTVPVTDFPDRRVRASVWYYPESITPKGYVGITITFIFPLGHTPFQVAFNADSLEIANGTSLGVLTVTPHTPSQQSQPAKP